METYSFKNQLIQLIWMTHLFFEFLWKNFPIVIQLIMNEWMNAGFTNYLIN